MAAKSKVTTKKLDTLFSKLIRAVGKCHVCGTDQNLQCCHIISRRYHQTRWDLRNAIAMCRSHHVYYTYRPIEWEIYIEKSFGKKHYLALRDKAQKIGKLDHNQIYEDLKKYEVHFQRLYGT